MLFSDRLPGVRNDILTLCIKLTTEHSTTCDSRINLNYMFMKNLCFWKSLGSMHIKKNTNASLYHQFEGLYMM